METQSIATELPNRRPLLGEVPRKLLLQVHILNVLLVLKRNLELWCIRTRMRECWIALVITFMVAV